MTLEEHKELTAMVLTSGVVHFKLWLEKHPPVAAIPLDDLRHILQLAIEHGRQHGDAIAGHFLAGDLKALISKYSPQPSLPPNPHQQGTYLWAREEHKRGHAVGRGRCRQLIDPKLNWRNLQFTHDDIVSVEWEAVK